MTASGSLCPALKPLVGRSSPRITVVRPGGLGDTILLLPTLQWFRGRLPDAVLTLIGSTWAEKLLPLIPIPLQFASFDSRQFARLFVAGALQPLPPALGEADAVILYTSDPGGPLAANLTRGCSGPVVIWPTAPALGLHAAAHFAGAVSEGRPKLPEPTLSVPEKARRWAAEWLGPRIGDGIHPVAIHPGSGGGAKRWPPEAFAEVHGRLGKPVLLIQGPADTAACAALHSLIASSRPLALASDLGIVELAAVLDQCELFVGNDSGVSHLAAALGVPTIAVFGATDPSVWAPAGRRLAAVGGTGRWPAPDAVLAAAARLLG